MYVLQLNVRGVNLKMDFGTRVKALRKKNKHTLQELAKKINFNYSNLSKIERGDRKPTLEFIEAISKVYDVSISYLVGEEYTRSEKDFMGENTQLSVDELKEKYNLVIGDRPATNEEIEEMIKYILIRRQMN